MANAYILVLMGILLAKVAGFLRDAVFASVFGTGVESDIYFQIFGVASLVFTAVGSALSTLIIKNINKPQHSYEGGQEKYAAHFMKRISLMILILTALMYAFAKPLVHLLLPGISGADFTLAVRVMYIMLPSFLFICVAYMMSGLLQNRRVFFTPSIMSLPYNAIAVLVLLFGVRDILVISAVTTLGWFLHIIIQLPDFYRKGYRFVLPTRGLFTGDEVKDTYETVFIFISGLMLQLCFMTDKIFAGTDAGMVSTLSYASNLFITFSGLFVVAMSSVVFPAISQNYEHGEMDYVRELIRYMIKLMVTIFSFYLVAVIFFGDFAVSMIYERGAFTHTDTIRVTWAFIIYSLAIFGYLAQNVLNKLFYLAGKYKVTVLGTVAVVAVNAVVDYFFAPVYGTYFVAVTTTVLLTLYAVFTAIKLKGIIGGYITKELLTALGKIALSTLMSVVAVILFIPFTSKYGGYEHTIIHFAISAVVYALSLLVTGVLKDLFTTPLSRVRKG